MKIERRDIPGILLAAALCAVLVASADPPAAPAPNLIQRLLLGGNADAGGHAITNAVDVVTTGGASLTNAAAKAVEAHDLTDGTEPLDTATVVDRSVMVLAGWGGDGAPVVNGTYTQEGTLNGKPVYGKDGTEGIAWSGGDWYITTNDGATMAWTSAEDVATPDLVTTWIPDDGTSTPGTVTPGTRTLVDVADKADAAIPVVTTATENNLAAFDDAGAVKDAGVAATAFARAPADVATNAAKLALTGISAGHIVRVTGEANRLEMYTGGAINSDADWQIIGANTYRLYALKEDYGVASDVDINSVTIGTSETEVGWVREAQPLDTLTEGWAHLSHVDVVSVKVGAYDIPYIDSATAVTGIFVANEGNPLVIPIRAPDRCAKVLLRVTVNKVEYPP